MCVECVCMYVYRVNFRILLKGGKHIAANFKGGGGQPHITCKYRKGQFLGGGGGGKAPPAP